MAISLIEKMRLSKELIELRGTLADKTANPLARMKATRRLTEVRKQMGFKTSSTEVKKDEVPQENPDLKAMLSGGWNSLRPEPFIKKVEALVGDGIATLSDAVKALESYLQGQGVALA